MPQHGNGTLSNLEERVRNTMNTDMEEDLENFLADPDVLLIAGLVFLTIILVIDYFVQEANSDDSFAMMGGPVVMFYLRLAALLWAIGNAGWERWYLTRLDDFGDSQSDDDREEAALRKPVFITDWTRRPRSRMVLEKWRIHISSLLFIPLTGLGGIGSYVYSTVAEIPLLNPREDAKASYQLQDTGMLGRLILILAFGVTYQGEGTFPVTFFPLLIMLMTASIRLNRGNKYQQRVIWAFSNFYGIILLVSSNALEFTPLSLLYILAFSVSPIYLVNSALVWYHMLYRFMKLYACLLLLLAIPVLEWMINLSSKICTGLGFCFCLRMCNQSRNEEMRQPSGFPQDRPGESSPGEGSLDENSYGESSSNEESSRATLEQVKRQGEASSEPSGVGATSNSSGPLESQSSIGPDLESNLHGID